MISTHYVTSKSTNGATFGSLCNGEPFSFSDDPDDRTIIWVKINEQTIYRLTSDNHNPRNRIIYSDNEDYEFGENTIIYPVIAKVYWDFK